MESQKPFKDNLQTLAQNKVIDPDLISTLEEAVRREREENPDCPFAEHIEYMINMAVLAPQTAINRLMALLPVIESRDEHFAMKNNLIPPLLE